MTGLTQRLDEAWKQAVLHRKIINQFEAVQGDSIGRWAKGDRIIYGVRYLDEQFVHYAHNLDQACDIKGVTTQKRVSNLVNTDNTNYLCRLNSYRALRPGVGNRPLGRQPDIPSDPALCRFHCQDREYPMSLLKREPLLTVSLTHFTWSAYYNVAPLDAEGHFLWLPTDPAGTGTAATGTAGTGTAATGAATILPHWLQQLTPALIEDAIELFVQLSDSILFFNALHVGASVNHIHLQSVPHRQPLPVEAKPIEHYKGYTLLKHYPVQAAVFSPTQPVENLIFYIETLQHASIPFNLVMISGRILVMARNRDHPIVSEFPADGLAALEMCGAIATVEATVFETITATLIESAFQKTVIPARQVIDGMLR